MLEHVLRHLLLGPASCRCPLLAAGDTIPHRERHFSGLVMALTALTENFTSPNVCDFRLYAVRHGER